MDSHITPIKVSLFGAAGKMGGESAKVLAGDPAFQLVNLIERADHPALGTELCGITIRNNPYDLELTGTVFCDFTGAEASLKNAALAAELNCPILVGSTGFDEEQTNFLCSLGEKIPIMLASNMSRGINLLYRLLENAAPLLISDYQVEVVETHHKWKKDAPSGTAREILRVLSEGGFTNPAAHSLRMGDVVGEHQVIFSTEGETLILTHRAHSRLAFAKGVIPALKFLAAAKPGCYSIREALM